jgi:ATP-binding cassette subfamily G (WHITE) protein 2 (SNQ2)
VVVCPVQRSTSSFLVTNPDGRKVRDGFEGRVPQTSEEMAAAFLSSPLGQVNRDAMEDYRGHYVGNSERKNAYRQSVVMEHASTAPKSNPYIISIPMQVRAVMVRRVQIIKGDKGTVAVQLVYVCRSLHCNILLINFTLACKYSRLLLWGPSS